MLTTLLLIFLLTESILVIAQPRSATYNTCTSCTPACSNNAECLKDTESSICQCVNCADNCPSDCTCDLVPVAPGSYDLVCNQTCSQPATPALTCANVLCDAPSNPACTLKPDRMYPNCCDYNCPHQPAPEPIPPITCQSVLCIAPPSPDCTLKANRQYPNCCDYDCPQAQPAPSAPEPPRTCIGFLCIKPPSPDCTLKANRQYPNCCEYDCPQAQPAPAPTQEPSPPLTCAGVLCIPPSTDCTLNPDRKYPNCCDYNCPQPAPSAPSEPEPPRTCIGILCIKPPSTDCTLKANRQYPNCCDYDCPQPAPAQAPTAPTCASVTCLVPPTGCNFKANLQYPNCCDYECPNAPQPAASCDAVRCMAPPTGCTLKIPQTPPNCCDFDCAPEPAPEPSPATSSCATVLCAAPPADGCTLKPDRQYPNCCDYNCPQSSPAPEPSAPTCASMSCLLPPQGCQFKPNLVFPNCCEYDCPAAVPEDIKPGFCPTLNPGAIGTCILECIQDANCSGTQKCCSNGCGLTCQDAVMDEVRAGSCPTVPSGTFGSCIETCSHDGNCSGTQKCCSNGCGHTCQDAVTGCEYNGTHYNVGDGFQSTDGCNSCSCIDNGVVTCTLMLCADGCNYNGTHHSIGASFPSTDGCNTCTCTEGGTVGCTSIACSTGCNYNGTHYNAGDSFASTDGCNTCTCGEGGSIGCTKKLCTTGCNYNGAHYNIGDSFRSIDGCNTCSCTQNGVICTLIACVSKPGNCPAVQPGQIGDCAEHCTADRDCPDAQKCCSNGCGHSCQIPVTPAEPAPAERSCNVCGDFSDCYAGEVCCGCSPKGTCVTNCTLECFANPCPPPAPAALTCANVTCYPPPHTTGCTLKPDQIYPNCCAYNCPQAPQPAPTSPERSCNVCGDFSDCYSGEICCGCSRNGTCVTECPLQCLVNPCAIPVQPAPAPSEPIPYPCNLCADNSSCPTGEVCCGCGTQGTCQKSACQLKCLIGPCPTAPAPAARSCNLCSQENQCAPGENCCGCGTNGTCQTEHCMLGCPIGPCPSAPEPAAPEPIPERKCNVCDIYNSTQCYKGEVCCGCSVVGTCVTDCLLRCFADPCRTTPQPAPSEPAPAEIPPNYTPNCTFTYPTSSLPLCGDDIWSCPSSLAIPSDLQAYCRFDVTQNKCDWVCPSEEIPPECQISYGQCGGQFRPTTLQACANDSIPEYTCTHDSTGKCVWGTKCIDTEALCSGRCSEYEKPASCIFGTSLVLDNQEFQTTCRQQKTLTGVVQCAWTTNCGCKISSSSGREFCGPFPKPSDPCLGKTGTLTSYKCVMSDILGTCAWNVMCLGGGSASCSGQCEISTKPSTCPNKTYVANGKSFAVECVDAGGKCNWKTNCQEDECADACSSAYKPTTCPSPYALRPVDQLRGVISDCIKLPNATECAWVPRNCYPTECRVTLMNSSLYCGTERLNCPLRLYTNPTSICAKKSDGSCYWNYQCPVATTCEIYTEMSSYVLGVQPVPTCGNLRRPTCGSGQKLSSTCACSKTTGNNCQWINNCEDTTVSQCYLSKSATLGWVCGSTPVPSCCSDGSRFVPTYCDATANGGCTARGYCDRQLVVNIDLSVIYNFVINTTSPAPVPPPGTLTCSGEDQPKCSVGTPLVPSKCLCKDDEYGVRTCSWSTLVCVVENGCDTCENPCDDDQNFVSGNCIKADLISDNSTCHWKGLVCKDKPITPCNCDDMAPSPCVCGQKRDTASTPVCLRGLSGNCILQSSCIPDTCGGLGKTACECDYSRCTFITFGNSSDSDEYPMKYEGCFSPNSDTFKTLVDIPNVRIISTSPTDLCEAPLAPAPTGPSKACDSSCILDKCKKTISDQTQLTEAVNDFFDAQTKIRNSIDKVTGVALGKHFSLSVIVIGVPSLSADYSLNLTVIVHFNPTTSIEKPTKDHQRVFGPAVKKFLTKLGTFQDADATTSECEWQTMKYGNQNNQKRAELQDDSDSRANTFTASMTFSSTAVKRVFAQQATTAPVTTTQSNNTNTTVPEPVGSHSTTIYYSLFLWVFSAVCFKFVF